MYPTQEQAQKMRAAGLGWNLRSSSTPAMCVPIWVVASVGFESTWVRDKLVVDEHAPWTRPELDAKMYEVWGNLIAKAINSAAIDEVSARLQAAVDDRDWADAHELSGQLVILAASAKTIP